MISDIINGNCVNQNAEHNKEIIQLMMGSSYLSDGEIKILSNRKIASLGKRGLSSNEIMVYLYFKLVSFGGVVKYLWNTEVCSELGISPRDVYHVITALNKVGLIGVEGGRCRHSKVIRIRHYTNKSPSRFLSLNRTFFHKGEDDYEAFKSLSAGAKSTLIFVLAREKFRINEFGHVVPKTYGNSIEVSVPDIVKALGVQRDTVIQYIKEINEKFHDFFKVVKALNGTLNDRRLAVMQDKRIKYGGIISNAARRGLSTVDNKSCGFWRMFDKWLTCHGFDTKPIPFTNKIKEDGKICVFSSSTPKQKEENIRSDLFNNIIQLLKEGISPSRIYNDVCKLISSAGGIHEFLSYYLYVGLSPTYQNRIKEPV